VRCVRYEVRLPDAAVEQLAAAGERVIAAIAAGEVERIVEDEAVVAEETHHLRRIRDREIARGLGPCIEVLIPGVERDREHAARLPLEGLRRLTIEPDTRRAAAGHHVRVLFVEVPLGLGVLAWSDLDQLGIARQSALRKLQIDERAGAAFARPRRELDVR